MIKPENPAEVENAIVGFLGNHNYQASVTGESVENMPIIRATSETCNLWVARISPLGYDTDLVQRLTTTTDQISYVYRGTVYSEQPISRTVANYLWFRFLRELGLISRVPPVIVVVTSCNVAHLPWNELRL